LNTSPPTVRISGIAAASGLGSDLDSQLTALAAGQSALRPLAEFPDSPRLTGFGAWIGDRSWFRGRRYGAASNAAVRAAKLAVQEAGWSAKDRTESWIFGGSSRANVSELMDQWKTLRRPIEKFRASNSMHSEVTAAVSIELGIHGPWQMLANGCSAGLDALGMAWAALTAGLTHHCLVVSVETPITDLLLQGFAQTGLLAPPHQDRLDPYHPATNGFHPAEAIVAITLERSDDPADPRPQIHSYAANSDAYHSISLPTDAPALSRLLLASQQKARAQGQQVIGLCPHANGTPNNRQTELHAMQTAFADEELQLLLLKPALGHSLGASAALEIALLAAAMRKGQLPCNLPGLTSPQPAWHTENRSFRLQKNDTVIKTAIGMGGHNAVLAISA
jgi:3-oxoacyl-[acyl-carrier-protein] synthase II